MEKKGLNLVLCDLKGLVFRKNNHKSKQKIVSDKISVCTHWWGQKEKVCGNDALIVTQMFAIKTEDFSYFPPCWRKKAKFVAKNTICCGNIIGGDEMFIFTFLVRRRDAGRLRSAGMAPDLDRVPA